MNQNNTIPQPIKELVLPEPHYKARMVRANETYMLAGRGTFKTSRGAALYFIDMVYEMPRSTGVIVGLSFEHLGDNTIPPLSNAFEEFGFSHGQHFVIGKKPPPEWDKPYLGVLNEKYDHVITWHNGTIAYMVSLVKKASANGISAQWGLFDETKFMDEDVLVDEIFPIFRGNEETKRRFGKSSGFLSKFFATDKNADPSKIKWLLNKRNRVDQRLIDCIITMQLDLNELKAEYAAAGINKQKTLRGQIEEYEGKLNALRSKAVYVAEVSAKDVIYAQGQKWYDDKKNNTRNEYAFKVIYDNEDPDRPGEVFYPSYDTKVHCHEKMNDINISKELIIASDYQHSVAPIPVAQIDTLPGETKPSLNYVDFIYTLYPKGLRDAVKEFCEAHRNHINRNIYYVYDNTAIGKRTDADEYNKIVSEELQTNGWYVMPIYTGMAPGHYQKYIDTRDWMEHKNPDDLEIRLNKIRCAKLHTSISEAGAVTRMVKGKAQTMKDKRFEDTQKYPTMDQSETTHPSDAFDMINDAVLKQKLIQPRSSFAPISYR